MIKWKPQPRQETALARLENEILYGGARGGGKTDAGLAWLLYDKDNSKYRALVIRRNAKDLSDWVDRARNMYSVCGVDVVGVPAEIRFPSGAIIRTGHLRDENAYTQYQGHEYQKMLIEEITHIPREDDFEKLLGSCRSTVEGIKPQLFATTNPDGPGHKWVKDRFNIPDHPDDLIITTDEVSKRTRVFIPARIEDNPMLMEADPDYVRYLESIKDEELRKAWREGDWSGINIKGSYYREQMTQARKDGRIREVPYSAQIPVHTWWDIGVGDSTSIGFFQRAGQEWRMIDYYEASGEGLQHYIKVLKEKPYVYGEHYAPHDIAVREFSTGTSRKSTAQSLGINFRVAPNLSIDDGIQAVRTRFSELYIDEKKCARFIDCISQYRKEWDDKLGEYKNKPLHDWTSHTADMLRYWAVTPDFGNIIVKSKY